jgi:mRNA-degrading endonuclease RelE of RelBE toxin-antitoxin system
MRRRVYSKVFQKQLSKLKGQQLVNVLKKINEILACDDVSHYKNLRGRLKKYKRVYVNDSYVILFFGDDGIVYFVDYEHHDKAYDKDYSNVKF